MTFVTGFGLALLSILSLFWFYVLARVVAAGIRRSWFEGKQNGQE